MGRRSGRRRRRRAASVAAPVPAAASPAPLRSSPPPAASEAWPVGLLALLVTVSYLPAMLWGGFVFDDLEFILEESAIREGWSGLVRIWSPRSEVLEPFYRPLTYTTFWLEHKMWGFDPRGYHVVNVLLHLLNTVLLWRILLRLGVPGALLAAAVFAVHPVHVESVAWAIERKDMLSGLGYLSAMLAWLRFDATRKLPTYALALALFAAAVLAKNVVVTLPAALLVLQWFRHGRVTLRDVVLTLPFFAVAAAFVRIDLSRVTAETPAEFHYTILESAAIAGRAIWFYLWKLVWPLDLAVIYPHWDSEVLLAGIQWSQAAAAAAWAGIAALLALAAASWGLRGRIGRGPLAGLAFFVVTLSPALGFIDHTYMAYSLVADRYQYLASAGGIAVVVGAAAWAGSRLPALGKRVTLAAAAAMLLCLGTLTWRQSGIYRDQLTFFETIAARNPTGFGVQLNLANALRDAGRLDEARAAGRLAIARHADSFDPYGGLVDTLLAVGDIEAALELAIEATDRFPDEAGASGYLGLALFHAGRFAEAETRFRRAVELDPVHADARLGLGAVLLNLRRHEEALPQLRAAASIAPGNSQAWAYMGHALLNLGRHDEALAAYDRALALDPRQEDAVAGREQALQAVARDD